MASLEDVDFNDMPDGVEEGAIKEEAPKNRGAFVTVGLVLAGVIGAVLFIVLVLMYFIIDLNLLGDPEPVWAHVHLFAPQLGLVFVIFQSLVYKMENNPLRAPAVWGIGLGLVAIVFDVVASFFYFRLFWKCVFNSGSFDPLESDMCDHQKTALYTIAWFDFLFFWHAVVSVVLLAWAYTSDIGRIDSLKRRLKGGVRNLSGKAKSLDFSLMKIHDDDDKFVAGLIGRMHPQLASNMQEVDYRRDARAATPIRKRAAGARVTRTPYGAV